MKRVAWILSGAAMLLAACGGEVDLAQSESAVERGEWRCGAAAVPYDLLHDCWMAETQLAEVCTRELDVDQPSAQQVQTCVIDAQRTTYAVSLGDRAELQAPDGWSVLVRGNDGSYTSDGFPMHELAHCADYIGSGAFVKRCEP
ncbi:hypothetical protein ACMHYB_50105 [Sorangium sp. So ce1128]